MSEVQRTALSAEHEALGARMVEFAGWYMPIQYTNIKEEHLNVRSGIGLFDVSHMGEVFFRGDKALENLQRMTSNDVSKLSDGKAQYSLILNEEGGVVDDIIIYCLKENSEYMVCVNAANTDKDFSWFSKHNQGADISNESSSWGQIAIQGKRAPELMAQIFPEEVKDVAYFQFTQMDFEGETCIVARTGYTGEDGYEVFCPESVSVELWRKLVSIGGDYEAMPIGLGARDSLRLECGLCLYGHDLDTTTTPVEASLLWGIQKVRRADGERAGGFPGADIILKQIETKDVARKRIGLVGQTKAPVREGAELYDADGNKIGVVTSGTAGPNAGKPVSMGYVRADLAAIGTELFAEVRGKMLPMTVEKMPFVPQRYYRG